MRHVVLMATILFPLLLANCGGEPAWNKVGGNVATLELDTSACFRGAPSQAERQLGNRATTSAPQIELRGSQGRVHDTIETSRKAISLKENSLRNRLYSECMHRLGYRLNESS